MARLRLLVVLLVVGILAMGCASVPRAPQGQGAAGAGAGASDGHEPEAEDTAVVDVRVDAAGTTHLVVTEDDRSRELATVPAGDGEVVHTSVRPSAGDPLTVLVLVRRDDPAAGTRYELHYAVDTGEERLEGLPSHLQVDTGTALVLDVPPLPVWAPDGSAVAWVEWNPLGTRLRALGWDGGAGRTRPASDAVAYRLDEVPPGVQLDGWEDGDDGVVVLTGRRDGERWRIAVEHDRRHLALTAGSR